MSFLSPSSLRPVPTSDPATGDPRVAFAPAAAQIADRRFLPAAASSAAAAPSQTLDPRSRVYNTVSDRPTASVAKRQAFPYSSNHTIDLTEEEEEEDEKAPPAAPVRGTKTYGAAPAFMTSAAPVVPVPASASSSSANADRTAFSLISTAGRRARPIPAVAAPIDPRVGAAASSLPAPFPTSSAAPASQRPVLAPAPAASSAAPASQRPVLASAPAASSAVPASQRPAAAPSASSSSSSSASSSSRESASSSGVVYDALASSAMTDDPPALADNACPVCYETLGRGGERKRVLHPCGHAVCDGCFDWWLQNNALARFMRPITIQCPRCLQRATSVQTPPVTDKHPIRLLVDSRLTTAIRAIALTLWCEAARYIPPLKDRRGNVAKMARQMYAQNANGDSTLRNLFQYLSTEFARSPAVLREAGPSLGERAAAVVAQVLIAHPETRQGEMSNDKETLEELDALIEPAKALANAFSKPSGFGTIRMASVISTFNIQYDTVEWDDIERERFRDDNSTNPSVYR